MAKGYLLLEDGTILEGESFGAQRATSGEVVFSTSMVGYPEALTDPSYHGQLLVLTYPLIGNYGVAKIKFLAHHVAANFESEHVWVKALIVGQYVDTPSHYASHESLSDWLTREKIPALCGIDTRALTQRLREKGVMKGQITFDQKTKDAFVDINSQDLLTLVSIQRPILYTSKKKRLKKPIILFDCGIKHGMIRALMERNVSIHRVPWNWHVDHPNDYSGVMISNGPGDPVMARQTVSEISQFMKTDIPIFGICLGNQILALAAGGTTYKLKYGHRSCNQPVQDRLSLKSYMSTHNHGFAVQMKSLSGDWQEWFINLNDGTNEGIIHKKKPFFTVQFHAEANPGPEDTSFLFDYFCEKVEAYEKAH